MEKLIELKNIHFISENFKILDDISLSFQTGKCSVIMGPSGCGKSALLKVIAGIYPPDEGSFLVKGEDFFKLNNKKLTAFRKNTGFVFQDSALWANLNIYQNLSLPLQFHYPGLSRKEIETRINMLVQKVNFTDSLQYRPAQLSTGERKVLSFLRAIITEPVVLFLDEPTDSVDFEFARILRDIIKDFKEKEATIVAVTHDASLISQIADQIIVLQKGKIVESDSFENIKKSDNPYVRTIFSQVLGEAASYDTDLLDLLDGSDKP
ncbi:MAG: ATP-binding cassette domain-containing protein [Spirochaetales bacterium]|nr:ATP-binding cassette domain-containing protein [Spirochaetales bacterium]